MVGPMSHSPPAQRPRRKRSEGAGKSLRCSIALLAMAIVGGMAFDVRAHGRSVSYSTWDFQAESAVVTLRLKLLEVSRLGPRALAASSNSGSPFPGVQPGVRPGVRDIPAELFPGDLVLIADGKACESVDRAERLPDEPGWARYRWKVHYPPDAISLTIRSRILLEFAPSHLHFARVRRGDDRDHMTEMVEKVLTEASPEF